MEKFISLPANKQTIIIDAALTTFGTNGYKKTSTGDIAAAAGISKAMVFHYFGTKKALYLYLIDYCSKLIVNEMDNRFDYSVTDFFDKILLASEIKLSVLKKHPSILTFLSSVYFEKDEEIKDDIKTILSQSDAFRNKIVFDNMDNTKFKPGVPPELVFKMLLWMAEGFASHYTNLKDGDINEMFKDYFECMDMLKSNLYKEEYLK